MVRARSLNVGATIAVGLLAAMCGERPGTKVRIQPLDKAAAGTTSGAAAAAGRGTTGSSGGTGGTANGNIGAGGENAVGEGGGSTDDDGGSPRGGTSSRGGSAGRGATGGTGASDSGGDSGATNPSGGAAGDDANGGHDDGGSAGDSGETGTGGRATGGSAGQLALGGLGGLGGSGGNAASAGGGVGGSAGAGSCELKTGCCAPDDPPCLDGCPSNADFCCNVNLGARTQCDPSASYTAVVCLDCGGESFGTQPCSTSCVVATDPPCSDATWDDACSAGTFAYCSDEAAGYRAGCYASGGGSLFLSYVSCTCDPDS